MSDVLKTIFLRGISLCLMIQMGVFSQSLTDFGGLTKDISFERISLEAGQPNVSINCMLQDHQGFMWFGTPGGLAKYDGYSATIYKYQVSDTTSISGDNILCLFEDASQTLWAGTLIHGLNRFDRKTGKFRRFMHDPDNPRSLLNNQVYKIYQDRSGTIWVGTTYGLNRYDQARNSFTRFLTNPNQPDSLAFENSPKAIYQDKKGILWVGTIGGLYRLDHTDEQLHKFTHDPADPYSLSANSITGIIEDEKGNFWISTDDGGLNYFDQHKNQSIRFMHDPTDPGSISNNTIWSILIDRHGTLWAGTEGGVNILDRQSGKFTRLVSDPDDPHSIGSNYITSLVEDRTGAIWVGSGNLWGRARGSGFGIDKWDTGQAQFRHLSSDPVKIAGIKEANVHCITEDRMGRIWLGTWRAGLFEIDRATGEVRQFRHDPTNPQSIGQNSIMSVYEDRAGVLWVGTADRGLNRFNRSTNTFTHFMYDPNDPNSLGNNRVTHIYEDRSGKLWIVTFGSGLNHFDRRTKLFTRFTHNPGNPHSIGYNLLASVAEDSAGYLWVGTWGRGLDRFDPVRERFTHYVHDPANPGSISNNITWDVHVDQQNNIWVATTGGVNKLNRATGQFTRFTATEGLASNLVKFILEDDRGRYWFGTSNGLTRYEPRNHSFKIFTELDGLGSNFFSYGDPWKTQAGELVISGGGINIFHPDSIRDNPHIPPVMFTRFTRYRSDNLSKQIKIDYEIAEKGQIELNQYDRTVTFDFTALNYRNSAKNQFAYKLEGAQNEWIFLGKKRNISFTNLAPGNYVLRVKGANNDGIWNEQGTSLRLIVHPPWWKTWWAYLGYGLLAFLALFSLRRYEMTRQQLKHDLEMKQVQAEREHLEAQKLKELDRMKSHFFANISHEFRTPLTLILGPLEQLLSHNKNAGHRDIFLRMRRNAQRLQRLINQLLDLSKLEAGKMTLKAAPQDIVQLTKFIVTAFESLAGLREIELELQLPEKPVTVYLERDKFEKIITNLLSNALKFTPEGGTIRVTVDSPPQSPLDKGRPGGVEIRIRDTGIGIPPEKLPHIFDRFYQADGTANRAYEGTGIGLALTKELVELHDGTIRVESRVGSGTIFTVRLPLGKSHLQPGQIVGIGNLKLETGNSIADAQISNFKFQVSSDEQPMTTHDAKQMAVKPTNNKVILIVEDNPDMREYMRGHLENQYRVLEAKNGAAGLKAARKHIPTLIISDVMMPEMNGFALCEKLKTDARTSHIPVILLTARASGESKIEGLETGADDYLTKPFDARELLVRVRNLIDQRRRLRARFHRELIVQPSEVTVTSMDEAFLTKVMATVEAHIDDTAFNTDVLANEAGVSRGHLNRKLRALTGQSVRGFIRTIRLKRAAKLLQQQSGTVTEVAYEVGFQSIPHFAKIFREQFGKSPSEYGKDG